MAFFKRIFFFGLINIAMVVMISAVLRILGVGHYMTQAGINYQSLAIFCLMWGMVGSIFSLLISKFMAKRSMGVKIVEATGPYASLVTTVHQLAKKAGIKKMPEVGIFDSPQVNAFATGPSKNNSLVAVSSGLLNGMKQDEVEGVLGHEIAHIANGDMVTMTLLQGVINAFVMFFARIAAFAVANLLRGDNDEGRGLGGFAHIMVVMLFETVFGFLGMMVAGAFSRWREFRADAGGASLAGKEKMIRALQRLQDNYEQLKNSKQKEAFKSLSISSKGSLLALLSTHPPLEKRIERLRNNSIT